MVGGFPPIPGGRVEGAGGFWDNGTGFFKNSDAMPTIPTPLRACAAALSLIATFCATVPAAAAAVKCPSLLSKSIPKRAASAPAGSEVMARLADAQGASRDAEVVQEVLSGNVPGFLRRLAPVTIPGTLPDGAEVTVTVCVTPEYLAVGDDRDFVRVPMGLAAAARVATEMGFVLPTTRIVDAIHAQARVRLAPRPMTPTPQMESTAYLLEHDRAVDAQRAGAGQALSELAAGQKKDIVLTNRLRAKPGRVAIYGWHRPNGRPIQPLSTVHGAGYADYSHGVRLVSQTAFVDGRPVALVEIMQDSRFAPLVSSEGPIADAGRLLASQY